jgi:hypothetical protein
VLCYRFLVPIVHIFKPETDRKQLQDCNAQDDSTRRVEAEPRFSGEPDALQTQLTRAAFIRNF